MRFGLLGPVEVRLDGAPLPTGGPKQRALLAFLLLHRNRAVSRDRLIDALWGDSAPPSASAALDAYVYRLRKLVGSDRLPRSGAGYALIVEQDELDIDEFERLVAGGRAALAAGDAASAAHQFATGLAQWRGPPLADIAGQGFADSEITRLQELQHGAIEDRVAAHLALGRHEDAVGELRALVTVYPHRERLHEQLMTALYRCGRQAEALEAYQAARRVLAEEYGLDPAPALQRLEHAILRQDASLELPEQTAVAHAVATAAGPAAGDGAGHRSRVFAVVGVLGLTAAMVVALTAHRPPRLTAGPDTVGFISAGSTELSAVVTGVGRPNGIASGAGAVWVTDSADGVLLRIGSNGQVNDSIPVGHGPAGVTVGDGEVWVANELDGTVSEVNPGAGQQVATIRVGIGPTAITFGYGSVWVTNVTDGTLSRIDASTGVVTATIAVGGTPDAIAAGAGEIWVTSDETGELLGVNPADNRPSRAVALAQGLAGVAVGAGAVWVADAGGSVSRFDPRTGTVRKINIGGAPSGIALSAGQVWVADSQSGGVTTIDPRTGAPRVIHVGNQPTAVAATAGGVWTTVLPSLASHRGGTLTLIGLPPLPDHPPPPTDPAVAYYSQTWQMLSLTNDGLVGYRRVAGLAGDELVPDLATALPSPSDGGKTYTFRLRSGIRYSTGALVRPADIRRAIERVLSIDRQQSPSILPFYEGIVGATQCEHRARPCDLGRGIVTDDVANTVTFHLVAPDPDFLYKLAFSWAYPVPAGTPDHVITAAQLPATGPYMTKSLTTDTWILVRNPWFREWAPQAQPGGFPDRIVLLMNVSPDQEVADIERGTADVLLAPPSGSIAQLATHYTSQLHSGPLAGTVALSLNTRVAPFDKLAARQAVSYAIDRNTVIALNGGSLTAKPTCQILPPTMPGYQPYCPYTIQPDPAGLWTAPNLPLARGLVRASGTLGDRVTVLYGDEGAPFPSLATARYVVSVLRELGYKASLRVVGPDPYYGLLGDSRDQVQAGFFSWYQDYPAPSDFVEPLFSCGSFLPGNPDNINSAEFCDPGIDALASQAMALRPGDPSTASRWAAIDRQLVAESPWVSLYYPRDLTVLSTRVGNYQFHPYWNLLIDQLWVR
jgi:YVTN family beta-propeller protein